jgi:drug/metabolite transporter (DMT)-like permease
MLSIYMIASYLFSPANTESSELSDPPQALLLAFIGCVIGWLALEVMVIGLRMSKSALASYGEQVGVVVPFLFDAIALCRPFLKTDWIAVCLILTLEIIMAMQSLRKKGEEIGKEVEE